MEDDFPETPLPQRTRDALQRLQRLGHETVLVMAMQRLRGLTDAVNTALVGARLSGLPEYREIAVQIDESLRFLDDLGFVEHVPPGQPMATAPKDRPILVWCDHAADPCVDPDDPTRLTLYAAHAEGLSHAGTGWRIVVWGGAYDDPPEEGDTHLPDWWFVDGSDFEIAANPLLWWELPAIPGLEDPAA